MIFFSVLSEALLYLCFSITIGFFLLNLFPASKKPETTVPKWIVLAAVAGIAIFSFMPVLKIVLYLYQDLGVGLTLSSVLSNFEVGKAWTITGGLSLILLIFLSPIKLERNRLFSVVGLIMMLALVGALGWSSHARSLSKWPGFFTHTTHFLAITIWIGILFNVSWFSKNHHNWNSFLKWFTPLAAFCFLTASVTGIILMSFVMNIKDYANVWMLPYGQMLLLKHLAIIPLLLFAFINGVLIRKRMAADPHFNPLLWVRMESVFALIIFSLTGALGMQSPPHDIKRTILSEGVSSLWKIFHGSNAPMQLSFTPGFLSAFLLLLSAIFLVMTIASFIKSASKSFSLFMGISFIVSTYYALMLSVH